MNEHSYQEKVSRHGPRQLKHISWIALQVCSHDTAIRVKEMAPIGARYLSEATIKLILDEMPMVFIAAENMSF